LSGWFDDTPQRRVEFSFGFRSCAIGRREAWGFDMGRSEFMGGIHDLDIGIGRTVYLFRHLPSVSPLREVVKDSHSFYPQLKLLHPLLQKLINYQLELDRATCLKSV
jgi:hypothetical protein